MSEILQKGFDDAQGYSAVRNPRGARQRWEPFRKVENCRGTTAFKVPKNLYGKDSGSGVQSIHYVLKQVL